MYSSWYVTALYEITTYFLIPIRWKNWFLHCLDKVNFGHFVMIVLMMNYDFTHRRTDFARQCVMRGACSSRHFRVKSILLSLSNIVIYHQNYHDVANFTNLTTFTIYNILKACIISVNIQIMKWHNKDPGSKNLPPPKSCPQNNLDGWF